MSDEIQIPGGFRAAMLATAWIREDGTTQQQTDREKYSMAAAGPAGERTDLEARRLPDAELGRRRRESRRRRRRRQRQNQKDDGRSYGREHGGNIFYLDGRYG